MIQFKYRNKSRAKNPRAPRPHQWISGPDELTHEKYYAWHKHRSQAHYRGELHELTFDDWLVLWSDPEQWDNRGRQKDCWVLSRQDIEKSWSLENCVIITRYEQLLRQIATRTGRSKNANGRVPKDVKNGAPPRHKL
jgi:hypothetical protein